MKIFRSYVWFTVAFGALAAGIGYFILMAAGPWFPANLLLAEGPWLMAGAYCLVLTRWTGKKARILFFPFLLLAVSTGFGWVSLFSVAVVLAWVRSGVCFTHANWLRRCLAEVVVMAGVWILGPVISGPFATHPVLGVWLFFLFQAAWFPLAGVSPPDSKQPEPDPFERAFKQAKSILNEV